MIETLFIWEYHYLLGKLRKTSVTRWVLEITNKNLLCVIRFSKSNISTPFIKYSYTKFTLEIQIRSIVVILTMIIINSKWICERFWNDEIISDSDLENFCVQMRGIVFSTHLHHIRDLIFIFYNHAIRNDTLINHHNTRYKPEELRHQEPRRCSSRARPNPESREGRPWSRPATMSLTSGANSVAASFIHARAVRAFHGVGRLARPCSQGARCKN